MTNSINDRLNRLNKKNEIKVAKRLLLKQALEDKARVRKPNEPNFLTAKQQREARSKFGSGKHCMICGKVSSIKKAHAVDHCHVTGKIRGILCYSCNVGLGCFKDSDELLRSALRYIVGHKYSADLLDDEALERLLSIQNR